jgi:hypothetical protein
MRAMQLLAIATVCPLVALLTGCERVVQPVGTYETTALTQTPAAGTPEAHVGELTTAGVSATTTARGAPAASSAQAGDAAAVSGGPADMENPSAAQSADASSPVPTSPGLSICTPTGSMAARPQRFDMYIVMDANFTLPITAGLWEFATTGLREFWHDARSNHLGLGLRFYGSECDPAAYDDRPTVEIGLATSTYAEMVKATATTLNLNASAMGPALEGGIRHQTKRAVKTHASKQVVVLLSDGFVLDDGFTQACVYTLQQVQKLAESGFTNSVETYVIGFGLPPTGSQFADNFIARFSPLNDIAKSGGSHSAQTIELTNDASKMADALHAVRRDAQPCGYELPQGIDLAKLGFVLEGTGELPRVDNANICGQSHGWYFDVSGTTTGTTNGAPAAITLCPQSCNHMADHSASFVLGCPPKRRVD